MIPELPLYISIVFALTTLLTVWLLYMAASRLNRVLAIIGAWLLLQGLLSASGFYTVTNTFPPRFVLLAPPAILFILILFATKKGKKFIDGLNTETLTWLHVVRIPVELVLYWLFVYKQVPQLMTFEGRNFDILSGLTAPLIAHYGYHKKTISRPVLLLWNLICLTLLFNIVVNAILSAPFPFQKFGFEQPNVAILYFPFVWLPCCVVPIVLFAHLVCIRQLINDNSGEVKLIS